MAKIDKQTIIQTAANLANKDGFNKITLKELAHILDVRSPSLYNHINGLDDLRDCLMLYGWRQLSDAVAIAAVGKSGDDAVRAMCKSYYDYTVKNPGVFETMMFYNQSSSPVAEQASKDLAKLTLLVLSAYSLDEEGKIHASRMFRSFLQGFSSLVNTNSFVDPVSIENSFDFAIDVLLNGLDIIKKSATAKKGKYNEKNRFNRNMYDCNSYVFRLWQQPIPPYWYLDRRNRRHGAAI